MPSLPSVSDLKTDLGLTGTGDDAMLATKIADAIAQAELDTGRSISASSNVTITYSTDGQAMIGVHDRPRTDPSRVVTWNGATMTEGVNVWFLPDRRDPNISAQVQVRPFDTSSPDWYKADRDWWDKNLDRRRYASGIPLDLSITGIVGMPFPHQDFVKAIRVLAEFFYWRTKSGTTGVAYTTTGEAVSLEEFPPEYQAFVRDWRIRTGVTSVG